MATDPVIFSKYSTGQGFENSGSVECRVLVQLDGQSISAPFVESDASGTSVAYNAFSGNLIVLPFAEAQQLRTAGMIDF